MFTDKLGGIELPPPPPINIKIKESPILFAIYTMLGIKIKAIQVFQCHPMKEGLYAVDKNIFDKSKTSSGFLKIFFGSLGSNFKTTCE